MPFRVVTPNWLLPLVRLVLAPHRPQGERDAGYLRDTGDRFTAVMLPIDIDPQAVKVALATLTAAIRASRGQGC